MPSLPLLNNELISSLHHGAIWEGKDSAGEPLKVTITKIVHDDQTEITYKAPYCLPVTSPMWLFLQLYTPCPQTSPATGSYFSRITSLLRRAFSTKPPGY